MRSLTLLAVLGLGCSAVSSIALAQPPKMDLILSSPPKVSPLRDRRIYKLTFSCNALADLNNSQASNFFIRKNATSSHFIVINDKLMSSDAASNTTVPTSGVAFFPVFAITNGVVKIDNRSACLSTQYITGSPELYLQAYANYSTQDEPGILLSFGYAIAGMIPPLWAMFNGKLSDTTKDQLTGYGNTEDPLKKSLAALDKEENYPASVRLSSGDYEVRTAFSSVRINVKYVPSILTDGGYSAMKFLRTQIDTSPQKIEPNNLGLCTSIALDLVAIGFSKKNDIPFALAYKGIRSGLNAAQASECLGADYAVAAASIKSGLWEYAARSDQILSLREAILEHPVEEPVPYQPEFDENRMKRFTDALSRLTRFEPVANSDKAAFSKALKEPITFDDKSEHKLFGGEAKEYITGSDLAEFFVKAGYRRFGCYQATNLFQTTFDGGKTLLFAFKADKDDVTLSIDNVALLKPIFNEKGAVTKLIAYDDFDWIRASMESRNWACGRIAINKPGQQFAPAVANAGH
jgi:hypothetical protein